MRIHVFGPPWDAPLYDDAVADGRVVEVPVGQPCHWCEEPIQAGDSGVMMASIDVAGKPKPVPLHRECEFRSVIGSVGHLLKKCPCYGGTMNDPEGMTKREAAIAAWDLFETMHRA